MQRLKGFTLVELAIVITIIGLLIGGVLKGQELLQNARMTSTTSQLKAYSAGVLTFKDIYKALPGDMRDPANFIQGCTTAPCNVSGNGNGTIGNNIAFTSDENNNFWLHLARANLVTGINLDSTWNSSTYYGATAPQPRYPIGGKIAIIQLGPDWSARTAKTAHYWHSLSDEGDGGDDINNITLAKFDLKMDDGHPTTGDIMIHYDNNGSNGNFYDLTINTLATMIVTTSF